MKSFERAIAELQMFCMKNDIVNGFKLSIVLKNNRDKAYFIKGLRDELQPMNFEIANDPSDLSEIRMRGINIRILS
jgi:hypothetical protein